MPSNADEMTTEEWAARIEPHLSSSLETVSERITHSKPVQAWLRAASTKAAEGLAGARGEMGGYMQLTEDLAAAFPNLIEAVRELTDGWGRLDLDWHPLSPTRSRLYITFDRKHKTSLFCRLPDCSPEAARQVLDTVAGALPESDPFPNRPNSVTGLVVRGDAALGVRVKAHRDPERGHYRSVTLLPDDRSPLENLSPPDAERALRQLLCSDASASE